MRKNLRSIVLVRSVMSLCEEAKTKIRVDFSFQKGLRLKWGCTKYLCCHLLFPIVVDAVTELANKCVLLFAIICSG